jgi:hypothetical protein
MNELQVFVSVMISYIAGLIIGFNNGYEFCKERSMTTFAHLLVTILIMLFGSYYSFLK